MALQEKYGRQVKFIVADTGSSGAPLAGEFGIMYIPAYIFINSSGERVGNDLAGYQSEEKLTMILENLLEN